MKTILVTGASGFVGRWLVRSLSARGDRVIALGRSEGSSTVDVADADAVRSFARTFDAVDATVHLAARMPRGPAGTHEDPAAFASSNVASLRNLLTVCGRQLGHFIYASSADVYGNSPDSPYRETNPLTPVTAYGESKAAGEAIVRAWQTPHPVSILRLSQIYGHGEPPVKVIPRFIERIRDGQPLIVAGGGTDRRRYLAVADSVRAFEQTIDRGVPGTFNIAGEEIVSIRDLVRLFEKVLGRRLPVQEVEGVPTGDRYMSIDHAREVLGFVPTVRLEDGLREYLTREGA